MDETAKETVIIVHGTFAAPKPGASRWYQPAEGMPETEGFAAKLNDALQKRGSAARCWAHCTQGDQGFHWSGDNSWVARTRAATELGNYVLKLRNEGWCCHIVAHSHGGNVVLEALLPQITTALPADALLGKIVTLGTPFMDTVSPILQWIRKSRIFVTELSRITFISFIISLPISLLVGVLIRAFSGLAPDDAQFTSDLSSGMIIFIICFVSNILFAWRFFTRKSQNEPVFNGVARMQSKLLAINSKMDEAWQLLNYMRNAPNPLAAEQNLIDYLISSMQSHISRSQEVARIYERKSYGDLKFVAQLFLALTHLMIFLYIAPIFLLFFLVIFTGFSFMWLLIGFGFMFFTFVVWSVLILLFTRMFGPQYLSAFFAPFRWCAYRLGAIKGMFREIATYIVRERGWSVVLTIAMGLEGYRHQLPAIERCPSSVPGVTYENMPTGAQQRALAKRGDWIHRHLNDVSETFSKLVVTSADIKLLLSAIEADHTLVHAAYYTDDDCIGRIADWIAAKDDMRSSTAIAAEMRQS
jgi:hypothetical protein